MSPTNKNATFHWILSTIAGAILGLLALQTPISFSTPVPFWMTLPFLLLLVSIAVTPLINPKWWHNNYPNISLFLAGLVGSIYGFGYDSGTYKLLHSAHEYLSFIALIGGLFFVSSCIKLDISGQGTALFNTVLLTIGAIISNVLGTTGASLLLIRPFIKVNKNRISPIHIVFFILIVSNCGGALTPIGDPPLYLGYLKGVPFTWTISHLWVSWSLVVPSLLILFYLFDKFLAKRIRDSKHPNQHTVIRINGRLGLICLCLMILAVFVDPILIRQFGISGIPVSAPLQILIASICFLKTPHSIKKFNEFTFEPFKEVALLFVGIFVTMIPALDYLATHGANLGLVGAKAFYFGTGLLSAGLDNAPTYLNFLQIAIGPTEINAASINQMLSTESGNVLLTAISSGAVFFGALTYIGNGPNFMVRSISEAMGVKMPSFLGYFVFALCILGPLLLVHALMLF